MTPFCAFRAKGDFIAETESDGTVHGLHPGDTAAVITYGGNLTTARILVPYAAPPDFVYPLVSEINRRSDRRAVFGDPVAASK